ncbi:MAG: orotate phosphoribosyltransferase [Candidatus Kentron sp. G]|nr:MAG: orotate phosphoribosyltransferase [Candidatus Kentron sp. G]VFM99034.1 MAG: orotate phosphoribosyltransferase [Candidatus Kentron sp. G]VFN01838.1 MAG: orotate phosphoribosyltransferase [Candidatus Kentron sp. G]
MQQHPQQNPQRDPRQDRTRLWQLIDSEALIVGKDMALSAGATSSYYFDCKKVTLHGEALHLIADAVLSMIDALPETPTTISGLTLGADFIVAGVIMRAWQTGHPTLHGAIVRKEPKKHGTRTHIENDPAPETPIVVVDDVITTGGSTARACDQLLAAGCRIVGIVALVDREAGGAQSLAGQYGCPVHSLFRTSDFPRIG